MHIKFLHNVSFLQSLSFTVKPGYTLALVGPSGCGKSTCVSLLQRYYDPLSGELVRRKICSLHYFLPFLQRIDEHSLKELNVHYARSVMSIVSQEPTLFDCSIEENITYGLEDVTHERVRQAAREANIEDFILSLPMVRTTCFNVFLCVCVGLRDACR